MRGLAVVLIGLIFAVIACNAGRCRHCGFYIAQGQSVFYKLAMKAGTDKVTTHNYEGLYTKYFETNRRGTVSRLLEVGLGCGMSYGPGASTKLWRWYFPEAVIWQAEFDRECVNLHRDKLEALEVKVLIGDQSDTATLHTWIQESGGSFDVIIDDGGHKSMMQFNSLMVLFVHALRPGGVYFLEDMVVGRVSVDGDQQHIIQDVVKDWIELLTMDLSIEGIPSPKEFAYKPRFGLPPGMKFVECGQGICAFTKCYLDDEKCNSYPGIDHSLFNYSDHKPQA